MLPVLPSRRISRFLFSLASGVLLALCFPNFSILPLLPVALIPLIAALDGARPKEAAFLGYVFGLVFWMLTIPWIAYTVHRFGGVAWPIAGLALAVAAAICAVPFAVMGLLHAWVAPRSAAGVVATFGASWVVQELFRTYVYVFGGFPWALLANPLADVPHLMGTTALGGVFLTSLLLASLNAALYVALTRPARNLRLGWLLGASLAGLLAAAAGPRRPRPATEALVVGVIQTNVRQDLRWEPGTAERLFVDLEDQTRTLCRHDRPVLVLWPESASPYAWSFSAAYRQRVIALCRELDTAILLSTIWSDAPEDPEAAFFNAAVLVTKAGAARPPYFKQRLVPFGEYVPLAWLLRRIRPISRAVPSAFTPGHGTTLLSLGSWKLGGSVCYEVVFPWISRNETRAGADVLFTLTNDAWYGRAGAQRQHFQSAVVRSIETGRPLVRAAITGISGAVDATGRVLVTLDPDVKGAFSVPLERPSAPPPAVAAGDAVAWVCAAGLLAGILRARVPGAPERPGGNPT
ncbi:MAG: apolipoprotein N-acyltransferase [Thermoanaerobaculia bacterium]|nr:apolipoprotein N-acyltransferase [Thermoanaerobaculia bacterium]